MRRSLIAASIALAVTALYIWLIYGFMAYVWPRLPLWATLLVFVVLATLAVGAPILALARLARRTPLEGQRRDRRE